jgi:hypothetical protein
MGTIKARDAAALLGYDFLGLGGFSSWVLSSVDLFFFLWDVLGVVSVLTTKLKHASG